MGKLAVLAIGGNSLIKDKQHESVEDQYDAVCETAKHIAGMVEQGFDVVVTHGNGPQVGFILRRSEIAHDRFEAAKDTQVIYARHWMNPLRYLNGKNADKELSLKYKDWRLTKKLHDRTDNAYFIRPMPVDRGNEVDDEVADSPRSIIYDIAENRLHTQSHYGTYNGERT